MIRTSDTEGTYWSSDAEHGASPVFQERCFSKFVDQQCGRVASGDVADGVGVGVDDVHAERRDELIGAEVELLLGTVEEATEVVRVK